MSYEVERVCSVCREAKPADSFYLRSGRSAGARVSACKLCCKTRKQAEYKVSGEARRAYSAAYRAANRQKVADAVKSWRDRNADSVRTYAEEYREANRAILRSKSSEYRRANRAKLTSYQSARKATAATAKMSWANKFFIEEAYDLASRRTKALGDKWEVDHIVPLKSKLVCGLHVERNLRVIPAVENLKKRNAHDIDCERKYVGFGHVR